MLRTSHCCLTLWASTCFDLQIACNITEHNVWQHLEIHHLQAAFAYPYGGQNQFTFERSKSTCKTVAVLYDIGMCKIFLPICEMNTIWLIPKLVYKSYDYSTSLHMFSCTHSCANLHYVSSAAHIRAWILRGVRHTRSILILCSIHWSSRVLFSSCHDSNLSYRNYVWHQPHFFLVFRCN